MSVHLMVNPIRPYSWGSRSALAVLQGRQPSGEPEAELWMGAHPGAPSSLACPDGGRSSLVEAVEHDPDRLLGSRVVAEFGPRLPFLLKVLAADAPLSLQVHPSPEQAAAGYADEERRGVPIGAAERCYKDSSHKPELLVALTDFDALCGFRPVAEAIDLFTGLDVPEIQPLVVDLAGEPGPEGLRGLLARLVTWPEDDRAQLTADVVAAAAARAGDHPAYAWVSRLAAHHGDDPGVATPLLLRTVSLSPGEALYLPPGNLHAYVGGVGIEVMACSDNVLRAALTGKHVDVDALLATVVVEAEPVPVLRAARHGAEEVWDTPAREFRLSRVRVGPAAPPELQRRGPDVVLCVEGGIEVGAGGAAVTLRPGESAFVEAGAGPFSLRGDGTAFRVTVGG